MNMDRSFILDFNQRRSHVKRYLAVVAATERKIPWTAPGGLFGNNRLNILRAGTFLILYNTIESAARLAIQTIHDEMMQKRVPFKRLRRTIRREVVKGFKRRGDADKHQDMKDLPLELVAAALDVEEYFSGNVDARKIKEIAEVYGFSVSTDLKRTRGGADLLSIKTIRNDLAHGHKTYEEVGREYPIKDLLGLSLRATAYVSSILQNIAVYLDAEDFLEKTEPADEVA
jgi:MAE_28990/MAE_18760-like HEPN